MIHHQKILFIFCLLIFHLISVTTENYNNIKLIFELGGGKILFQISKDKKKSQGLGRFGYFSFIILMMIIYRT